jgi:anaerobic magnesium-protoporphyrin IX monomethyl ester cyclase
MAWPPVESPKGYACASQNRQFQYMKDPTFIYPVVPATAMTMLMQAGNEVLWLDAIADEMNEVEFGKILVQMMPDYIVFEANTPLIKRYWEIIDGIKLNMPNTKTVLVGDHATALPEESKDKSQVDIILPGGEWMFDLFKIVTGKEWTGLLPHPDRNMSRWWLYAYHNGNFKFIPGTYIMSAVDCWHRPGCTFCSWANYYKGFRVRPVEDVLAEIEKLIVMGFKEIFDDSGTFPTGQWLEMFCNEMIERGYNKHISLGCNMRFGALKPEDFALMAKAGFRMVLWGFESANQRTLDLLNKRVDVRQIPQDLILAKAAGLNSHITVMFGYPWENYEDAKRTYDMARYFLINGWAWSAQATICIPYPGTPLFQFCKDNGLLSTEEWEEYDMSRAVMKTPFPEKELFKFQRGIYNTSFHPKFIWNKLCEVKSFDDVKYYFRIGRKIYDRFGNFRTIGKVSAD